MDECADKDILKETDTLFKVYGVAWSSGIKVSLGILMTAFRFPVLAILFCIPFKELPPSLLSFAAVITVASVIILVPIFFLLPYAIITEGSEGIKIITIIRYTICSCKFENISSVSSITFREYCKMKSTGIPTKWENVLAIHTDKGYAIIVSPEDPDTFINDLSYYF